MPHYFDYSEQQMDKSLLTKYDNDILLGSIMY